MSHGGGIDPCQSKGTGVGSSLSLRNCLPLQRTTRLGRGHCALSSFATGCVTLGKSSICPGAPFPYLNAEDGVSWRLWRFFLAYISLTFHKSLSPLIPANSSPSKQGRAPTGLWKPSPKYKGWIPFVPEHFMAPRAPRSTELGALLSTSEGGP